MDPNELAGLVAGVSADVTRIQGDPGKDQSDKDRVTRLFSELQGIVDDNARDIADISRRHRSSFDSKLQQLRDTIQDINTPR